MGNAWTDNYDQSYVSHYDLSQLYRDEFYLTVNNSFYDKVYLYNKYEDCFKCPYTLVDENPIRKGNKRDFTLHSDLSQTYRVLPNDKEFSLEDDDQVIGDATFGPYQQYGVYTLRVDGENSVSEEIIKEPVNIYFPILTVILIYLALFLCVRLGAFLWKHLKFERLDLPPVYKTKNDESKNNKRVRSLDTFRGICITIMIFVNYGHGGYAFLGHAVWNGLNVGDLVFPWFMWIMGVCIPISVASHYKKELSCKKGMINVLKRSCKLFAIGLFLGSGPFLNEMRLMGVLQRFAISYFVVANLQLLAYKVEDDQKIQKRWTKFRDFYHLRVQWLVVLLLVTLHTVLTFCFNVPGCPKGYLGPGGIQENGLYENCTGGVAGYIDNLILKDHLYKRAGIVSIYRSTPFDPEGIFGCLTSIFQVFLGVQAGTILVTYKTHKERLIRWFIWFLLAALIGGLLNGTTRDEGVIPINKHLWSLSFVFVTSSFAFALLTLCYILVDVQRFWTGKPFLFAGMNAILMYVGHSMVYSNFPVHWYPSAEEANRTHFLTLVENVWATSFWVLVAYYLYKIKYFWSL